MSSNGGLLLVVLGVVSLLLLSVINCLVTEAGSGGSYVLYVMGDPRCHACASLKSFLDKVDLKYYFCSLLNKTCSDRYYWFLRKFNIPPYIPLTFVIANSSIKAVVIGSVNDEGFWLRLINSCVEGNVPLYEGTKLSKYLNVTPKELLKEIAPQYLSSGNGACKAPPLPLTLSALVGLALSDSVNPCATYIYVVLLTSVALTEVGRRRRVLAVASAFIAAVFTGYYLLGLGIMSLFKYIPTAVLGFVAIAYGLFVIFRAIRERSKCVAPSKGVSSVLEKAKASIVFAVILGLIVTFTLLPCSSGPYLVFAGVISKYPLTTSLALLGLYNLIFVLPLIALAVLIAESMRYERVRDFMIRYRTHLALVASAVLVVLGIYIVITSY